MKKKASEIPVHCACTKIEALDKLVPFPRNPNQHPEPQIALLAKIIKAQGWRNPIVVSARSGFITKGHARLAAAKLLGVTEVPVDVQEYENEAAEWADIIADNRLAELSVRDLPMLKDLLLELDNGAFDMNLTGYDDTALADMMTALPPSTNVQPAAGELSGGAESVEGRFILLFSNDDEKQLWMAKLGIDGTKVVYGVADLP